MLSSRELVTSNAMGLALEEDFAMGSEEEFAFGLFYIPTEAPRDFQRLVVRASFLPKIPIGFL